MTVNGVDVSHHQGKISWEAVQRAGFLFAFAKATEGDSFTDPTFAANKAGAIQAGLVFGPYHFAKLRKDPARSAERFVNAAGLVSGQPWMLDLEDPDAPAGQAGNREWVDAFCDVVERVSTNRFDYTYKSWWDSRLGAWQRPGGRRWIANYSAQGSPPLPAGWPDWHIWQHSSKGSVPGIPGLCDVDRFDGSPADLLPASPAPVHPQGAVDLPPVLPPTTFGDDMPLTRTPARITLDDRGGWAVVPVPFDHVVSCLIVGGDDYSYDGAFHVAPDAGGTKVTLAEPGNPGAVDVVVWSVS